MSKNSGDAMIYCARFLLTHYVLVFDYLSDPREIDLDVFGDEIRYCINDIPDPSFIVTCSENVCLVGIHVDGSLVEVMVSSAPPPSLDLLESEEIENLKKIHKFWLTKALPELKK